MRTCCSLREVLIALMEQVSVLVQTSKQRSGIGRTQLAITTRRQLSQWWERRAGVEGGMLDVVAKQSSQSRGT